METEAASTDQGCRIMVVDDHVASGDLLREILSLEGYVVRVAHCGKDAMMAAREFKPRIALLDVGLPDMSGYALAKALKGDPAVPQMHLIALSGYTQSTDPQRTQEVKFDHYLVKPVDVEHLLSMLRSLS